MKQIIAVKDFTEMLRTTNNTLFIYSKIISIDKVHNLPIDKEAFVSFGYLRGYSHVDIDFEEVSGCIFLNGFIE